MTFVTPYVTDKFTAYLGDIITTSLSLAVWLIDDYTKNEPVGNIQVMIKEGNIKAVRNLSGYYCFTGLAAGNYTVGIQSDLYFPDEIIVDTSPLDPRNPFIEIVIKPKSAYPFSDNATLVRGLVSNIGPINSSEVKVVGKLMETITDNMGEFVLYFKGIKKEDIVIEIKKNADIKTVNAIVEEGKTISLGIITFP